MKRYFNTYYLKSSLIVALFLSLPLYLIHFGIDDKLLNSICMIIAIYLFYKSDINSYPFIGFFTSILWLWWIGLSFRYYGLSYLIPIIIFGIGIFYAIVFYILTLIRFKAIIILFFIFGFGYITPFGFNWFQYNILFPHTYFYFKKSIQPSPLKIKAVHSHIPQNKKWQIKFLNKEIENNFDDIKNAINKFDIVVLPETAFSLPIDKYPSIIEKLSQLSKRITIITGALSYKNGKYYNSTYLFKGGDFQIFNKHILVPFGEYIPFSCCKKLMNKIFFDGAEDYKPAPNFSTYSIKNIKFLNAICYEVTNKKLYEEKPKYIIAMSDNAWFKPSIEPTLQKLLIEYYSLKYNKFVYHSVNY